MTQDLLLEAIAQAGYDATGVSFDFSAAHMERLDGDDGAGCGKLVATDEECRRLRGAKGIRVSTLPRRRAAKPKATAGIRASSRGLLSQMQATHDGSCLLQPVDEEAEILTL